MQGGLLAHFAQRNQDALGTSGCDNIRTMLSLAGLSLIALAVIGFNGRIRFPGAWALIPVIGSCLLIVAGPGALVNRSFSRVVRSFSSDSSAIPFISGTGHFWCSPESIFDAAHCRSRGAARFELCTCLPDLPLHRKACAFRRGFALDSPTTSGRDGDRRHGRHGMRRAERFAAKTERSGPLVSHMNTTLGSTPGWDPAGSMKRARLRLCRKLRGSSSR